MTKKIVVIGGGQAAASFIARLRTQDTQSAVTLICEENYLPYQRPPLSKKYAVGDMSKEQLELRPMDWYAANGVACLTGSRVASVDLEQKELTTKDGTSIAWDQLLLATGSRPRTLPSAIGAELDGIYLLRDLEDADRFAAKLAAGGNTLIVGGGYIGLEAASVCASAGMNVTVVEAADRILQRVACKETSDWYRDKHSSHGVEILEGAGLARFEGIDGRVTKAVLSDGREIAVDFALIGIGIVPNSELASDAGLKTDNGIVVDAFCRTSHPDIYAAGDCTVFEFRGALTRLESVQNAIDQAECAADNMSGNPREYDPHPWFWSDQYDVKLQIAGLNRGYNEIVTRPGDREGSISHFYFKDGTFLAVDAINDPRTYMVCKKLLESGKSLTTEQAGDTQLQLKTLM